MALLPTTWPAWVALALILAGIAVAVVRRYPMSYAMAMVCIGVFVVQSVGPRCVLLVDAQPIRTDCVLAELSFIAPLTWVGERLLTPFTYMFVHADVLHIAGNLFILLTAGPALEERIGSRNFLVIYLLAGLAGAAATLGLWQVGFFHDAASGALFPVAGGAGGEFSPNIGASGAIFGVLTAFATLYPRERLPMILPMMFFVLWMPAVTVLLLYLAINVLYLFSHTNIAWWGHFAGFFVGLAVAPLLAKHLPVRRVNKPLHVDTAALQPLAQTNVQRNALRELDRLREPKTPDDRALAEVWWERFVASAQCPVCSRKMELQEGSLVCPNGDYQVQAVAG